MCGFGLRVIFLLILVSVVILLIKYLSKKGGSKMGILGKYLKRKTEQADSGLKAALLKVDFDTMSDAQISEMEEGLNAATIKLAAAKREADREREEAEQIEAAYQKKLKAAEVLESKVKLEEDQDTKASLEKSLSTLLSELEEMVPEVEREKQEAVEAQENVTELTELVNTCAENLKSARKRLTSMKRDLDRAELAEQKAKEKADAVAVASGIKKKSDSMSGIFETLQSEIDKSRTNTESLRIKTDKLRVEQVEEDPNIAAALREASGEADTSKLSLSDRLSALKG